MKTHQVDDRDRTWRGNRDDRTRNTTCAQRLSEERMLNREQADRKRAEYLRRHDDDEAELELPRTR